MIPLTAGTYLAIRREAAGLQLPEVARQYSHHALGVRSVELLFGEAEADRVQLGELTLKRLRAIFRFDPEIYSDLAEAARYIAGGGKAAIRMDGICGTCGCSWNDPCLGAPSGGCAWADASQTVCTACAPAAVTRKSLEEQRV